MRATQTFQTTARGITKLGIFQPPHYPIRVKRVHLNSLNVKGMVFQTFRKYKQRSCIQFITNEQVKLISFIFTLEIRYCRGNNLGTTLGHKLQQNLVTVKRILSYSEKDFCNLFAVEPPNELT